MRNIQVGFLLTFNLGIYVLAILLQKRHLWTCRFMCSGHQTCSAKSHPTGAGEKRMRSFLIVIRTVYGTGSVVSLSHQALNIVSYLILYSQFHLVIHSSFSLQICTHWSLTLILLLVSMQHHLCLCGCSAKFFTVINIWYMHNEMSTHPIIWVRL